MVFLRDIVVAASPILRRALWRLISFAVCFLATPTWSNGDLFFEALEVPGHPEYVVFGNVKDAHRGYVSNAAVTVSVQKPRLAYTSDTDILGRFRSLDIGRAIRGLGYEVDPAIIEVSVTYPRYHEVSRIYRGRYRQNKGAVEWNLVLDKNSK